MKPDKHTRRNFIKQSVAATTALLFASKLKLFGNASSTQRSKVIIANSPHVIDAQGNVNPVLLRKMIDRSILQLSGADNLAQAWSKYFTKEDIIGMKVNGNSYSVLAGTPMAGHFPLITNSLLTSMSEAELSEKNTIIWERSDAELISMGYPIQKEKGAPRILGTHIDRRRNEDVDEEYQPWFSDKVHPVGEKSTHLSNIIETDCTTLINLPALKSHRLAGVTGALKNHYGSIDNPREFHDNDCCSPGAAEINNIPEIRDKHRLVVCNALMGLWDGGPRWNTDYMWMEGSLIFGEDPVAVDTIMLKMIDEKRKVAGLQPVEPMAGHLRLSEELGLGFSNPNNIELINLEI